MRWLVDHCPSRRSFLKQSASLALAAGLDAAPSWAATGHEPVREIRRGGMAYRRLGRTDLYVSALAFGSHTNPAYKVRDGGSTVLNVEGQAQRDRHVSRALDLGVNLVDTYESDGQWEPVARLVRPRRHHILVSICRQFPMFIGENIDRAAKL